MGTRCLIQCEGSDVVIYRHWDGYPQGNSGVLNDLAGPLVEFQDHRGYMEPDMLLAFLVQRLRNKHEADKVTVTGYRLITRNEAMEFSDTEYLYTIDDKFNVAVFEGTMERWNKKYRTPMGSPIGMSLEDLNTYVAEGTKRQRAMSRAKAVRAGK